MRKAFFAALCCTVLSLGTAMAQYEMPQGGRQPMRGGMIRGMELVADTTITNQLEITPEQAQQIEDLNNGYLEHMKAASSKRNSEGKKVSREEREARIKELNKKRIEARQQLRKILGDNLYIEYLEQKMDRTPMMMGGPNGGRFNGGPQMGPGGMPGGMGPDMGGGPF